MCVAAVDVCTALYVVVRELGTTAATSQCISLLNREKRYVTLISRTFYSIQRFSSMAAWLLAEGDAFPDVDGTTVRAVLHHFACWAPSWHGQKTHLQPAEESTCGHCS